MFEFIGFEDTKDQKRTKGNIKITRLIFMKYNQYG